MGREPSLRRCWIADLDPGARLADLAEVTPGWKGDLSLRGHDLSPERCIMVGDRSFDADGAHLNGVSMVGVLWGYGDRDELLAAGVTRFAPHPAELIPIAQGHDAKAG